MSIQVIKKHGLLLASFFVPIVLLVIASKWNNIYPFGPNSFLAEDAAIQYVDFYTWYIRVLQGGESMFYNAYSGMGTNAWGIVSYYLSSPLNLLLLLFGEDRITLFLFIATGIKLGCMCAAMSWYLRKRFDLQCPLAIALALCYTWSTWTQTQMRNPQWLDALVLLPLFAWAMYKLVNDGKWLFMALVTACAVITCWYMAYMLLAYGILLFILEYVVRSAKEFSVKNLFTSVLRGCGAIVAGLGMGAFTFLPSVLQMVTTNASVSRDLPSAHTFQDVIRGTMLWEYGPNVSPQLFGGTILLVLLAIFVCLRTIPVRVRIVGVLILALLVVSTADSYLQLAWGGFKTPYGFYCRMTWLAIFTLVWMGARAIQCLQDQKCSVSYVIIGAVVALLYVLYAHEELNFGNWLSVLVMEICAVILIPGWKAISDKGYSAATRAAGAVVLLAVFLELAYSTHILWKAVYGFYNQESHNQYVAVSKKQLNELRGFDNGTYRIDKTYTRYGAAALNEDMARGYWGLSSYSSSQNGNAFKFLQSMGYSRENEIHIRYSDSILLMDTLLGIKYVSTDAMPVGYEDVGLGLVPGMGSTEPRYRFFKNADALSLAFGVDKQMVDAQLIENGDPFEEQNSLLSHMLGHEVEVYTPIRRVEGIEGEDAFEWDVEVPKGHIGYAYTSASPVERTLNVDGHSYQENSRWRHTITYLSDSREESKMAHVSLSTGDGVLQENPETACLFYALDWAAYQQAIQELSERQASVIKMESGNLELTYDANDAGYLMVSVPNEPGWTVSVNGNRVVCPKAYDGALTIVPVESGHNKINMNYVTPGFVPGCIISVFTIAASVGVWRNINNRRQSGATHNDSKMDK